MTDAVATSERWLRIPVEVQTAADAQSELAKSAQELLGRYPLPDETVAVRGPDDELLLVSDVPEQRLRWLKRAMVETFASKFLAVIPSAMWEDPDGEYTKVAYSPVVRNIGETMNLLPGKLFGAIPNAPGPVSSMLTSGLLGAGLGYGAGWVGEKMLPNDWRRGRLSRLLGTLGGIAGATPGLIYGATNQAKGLPFNDNSTLNHPPVGGIMPENHFPISPLFKHAVAKFANDLAEDSGMIGNLPPIQVDKFNQTLWGDPYVSSRLPLPTIGAATSAVNVAQQMPGGVGAGWVTPWQMGHLAAGMGVGYASGALVGGVLGLLTGMPDAAQDRLKQTGMYAGIVSQVVPILFGKQ